MSTKVQFLILKPSGTAGCKPDPVDWEPQRNSNVVIVNASGANQQLHVLSGKKLLKNTQNTWKKYIFIEDGDYWIGKVGKTDGDYQYEDGDPAAGPRVGTIDPS